MIIAAKERRERREGGDKPGHWQGNGELGLRIFRCQSFTCRSLLPLCSLRSFVAKISTHEP